MVCAVFLVAVMVGVGRPVVLDVVCDVNEFVLIGSS